MRDLAERWGMTPSGLMIVFVLIASIAGVWFLLPSQSGSPTVRVPDGFTLEKAQGELEKQRAAAEQALKPAAPAPEAQQDASGSSIPPSATAMATTPVAASSGDTALLSGRVGRLDPFAPILDQKPDEQQEPVQTVQVIPEDNLNPIVEEFQMPLTFPQPIAVKPPSFTLSAISTSQSGEHFVIINNEILKKGDFVPGTKYFVSAIDAKSMNKVTLGNSDPMVEPLILQIKRRYGDIDTELSLDGKRTFSNIMDKAAPPEDEMFDPGAAPQIQWKQHAPGGLPLPSPKNNGKQQN